ncbi:hypothetical protein BDV25DRAFT_161357 [Aspergillus avenaceus]|uniref:Pentatricopeptide repeat protein n=1 Tax=Aspergillus avenaceus TaxID=36643 RepID=A0A5N6TLP3_ASPAV|nr:hypothetical protein BDV25DRAFT_161357 [Aspergillus avenaceus]
MSLCPRPLLRARLSTGLNAYVPQHRQSPSHWYRQTAHISPARPFTNNATSSNPSLDSTDDDSADSPSFAADSTVTRTPSDRPRDDQDSGFQEPVFSTSSEGHAGSSGTSQGMPSEVGIPRPRRQNSTSLRTFQEEDPNPKFFYADRSMANGEILYRFRTRRVSQETYGLERSIRSKSMHYPQENTRLWRLNYSALYRATLYKVQPPMVPPFLRPTIEDLQLFEKIKTDCQGSFREAWELLDVRSRADHWMRLSLYLLQNSPELSLEFLLVTTQTEAEKPLFVMVADCCLYLEAMYGPRLEDWQKDGHTYESVLTTCLGPENWPVAYLPQKGTRLYLKKCGKANLYETWELVRQRQNHLSPETCLCFMRLFTEYEDADNALEALYLARKVATSFFTFDSVGVMRHCCKLLQLDSVVDTEDGRNFYILPKLLRMGIRPDRDMMNVVLANGFKTGDPQVGLDMYKYMKSQALEPDSYTYLALLSNAVSCGDRENVELLAQEIRSRNLDHNPWIASKMFHAYFTFNVKGLPPDADRDAIFYSLLDMYNQLHDITPLKELSIIPAEYTPRTRSQGSPPTIISLYLIIATYLRCQKRIHHAQRVFTRFKQLVHQGHPSIAPLTSTDHTYNEFLIAFRKHPSGLREAVHLVEDMLQSANEGQKLKDGDFLRVKPSIRTWTILMSAFSFNKQPHAAEKVREMMEKHGVGYSHVTWNTVINTYANAQNITDVVNSIKKMESQGYSMDSYTIKSFRYLQDPERLWVAVEELDNATETPECETVTSLDQEVPEEYDLDDDEYLLEQGLRRLSGLKKSSH